VAGLVADDLRRALVPDDDRAAAAAAAAVLGRSLVHALELAGGQLVVLHRHGEAPDGRVERGAFRHGPGLQHSVDEDAQVVVKAGRVMQLDHEA
jgi:hypothetical protein